MYVFIFFFKQKTAYEMRISDWSSDVCSSDLVCAACVTGAGGSACSHRDRVQVRPSNSVSTGPRQYICEGAGVAPKNVARSAGLSSFIRSSQPPGDMLSDSPGRASARSGTPHSGVAMRGNSQNAASASGRPIATSRSEEHTSELQSL